MTAPQAIPAGTFSSWLQHTRNALITGADVEVPCGECTACCTSSYFVHIKPTEIRTLTHINRKLLFPAPGLPKGNVVMGYDHHGACPLLSENKCSIYQHRPLTCRSYDCRIFAAAGIDAGGADKALINQRIHNWQFSYPTPRDHEEHAAVQAATVFLRQHAECFPAGASPNNPSHLAILAIKVYDIFLPASNGLSTLGDSVAESALAQAVIDANARFEARCEASH